MVVFTSWVIGRVNVLMFLKLRARPGHSKLYRSVGFQRGLEPGHLLRVMLKIVGEERGGVAPVKLSPVFGTRILAVQRATVHFLLTSSWILDYSSIIWCWCTAEFWTGKVLFSESNFLLSFFFFFNISKLLIFILFIFFIFGCVGSSFLCEGFL